MLKVRARICLLTTALLIVASGLAWAATDTLTAAVNVASPSAAFLKLVPWADNSTVATGNQIDFSTGATGASSVGKTSWLDGVDDGYTARDANVGFNLIAVAPSGSKLSVACGIMKDSSGHEIPYSKINEYDGSEQPLFGFSARSIPDTSFMAGATDAMQKHSLTGWNYTFPDGVTGKEIAIYNMLKVPVTAVPGQYSTSGSGNYSHFLITLI